MFHKNDAHRQGVMFTVTDSLRGSAKRRLERSWATTFYTHFFCRIKEDDFKPLYSSKWSRPNTPVNILVGLEALKSGHGWSDEELYDQYLFNLKIRHALGLHDIDEGYFDLRTLYYFRHALLEHEKETGINLITKTFQTITDGQIEQFALETGTQRMDSTLIQSNIRNMSRLQLLIEVLRNVWAILSAKDQERFAGDFALFIKEDALHYCYRVKPGESSHHLGMVGLLMQALIVGLDDTYAEKPEYVRMGRAFAEHFRLKDAQVAIKEWKELSGASLQSPYDEEATYRKKGNDAAKGYVANITETCDPKNALQLITQVSVAPNATDDQQLLASDLENLYDRMDVATLWTDGGYTGETASLATSSAEIEHRVTAVKGKKTEGLGLEDFTITIADDGTPTAMTCPGGQTGIPQEARKPNRFSCVFDDTVCTSCPLRDQCPTKNLKRKASRLLRFSYTDLRIAEQRRDVATSGSQKNIRAAVESTVRSVIHPFGGHLCKLPVRGRSRITIMVILSAAMVNIRRISAFTLNMVEISPVLSLLLKLPPLNHQINSIYRR